LNFQWGLVTSTTPSAVWGKDYWMEDPPLEYCKADINLLVGMVFSSYNYTISLGKGVMIFKALEIAMC
jgi:hypothetical protein